ncbi:MAG TPA: oxidoreductase, partial [Planctomycetota bacterium]|nr:oxidoreductase [Planctomycetota bacterium]
AAHGLLAGLAMAATLIHVVGAGGYARSPAVAGVVWGYTALVAALWLRYRLLRPLRLRRRPWVVAANRDEGADTRTLVVQPVGHAGFDFRPGQFAWLNTGPTPLHAEQHPLSISSSAVPGAERRLEFSIKALGDWSRSTVPALAPGARVWVDGPFGAFTPDRVAFEGLALIAGGIGIAPLRSMLLTLKDRGDRRPVVLVFAARDRSRAMFADELEALQAQLNLAVVPVYEQPGPGWTGERGFVTAELLRRHLPPGAVRWHYFVCGPGPMMAALERVLADLGVPAGHIHTERFDMV